MCGPRGVYSEGPPSIQVLLSSRETSDGLRIAGSEQEWGTSKQNLTLRPLDVAYIVRVKKPSKARFEEATNNFYSTS